MPSSAPGDVRHHGLAAGSDHNPISLVASSVDVYRIGIRESRVTRNIRDTALVQIVAINAVESSHISISSRFESAPVMTFDGNVITIIRGMMQLMRIVRRIPHHFFRYAPDIDASAAERAVFNDRRISAILCRALCVSKSTTTAANYQQIESF